MRDHVRDESLETPLNKGFLFKNVRDEQKRQLQFLHYLFASFIFLSYLCTKKVRLFVE